MTSTREPTGVMQYAGVSGRSGVSQSGVSGREWLGLSGQRVLVAGALYVDGGRTLA